MGMLARASLRVTMLAILTAWTAVPTAAAREQRVGTTTAPTPGVVSGRVIVEWEPGTTRSDRLAARADADADFVRTLGNPRFQLLEVEHGQSAADAVRELQADPAVRAVEQETYAVLHDVPNDPLFDELWGLRNLGIGVGGFSGALNGADIDAVGAWDRTVGSPSIVVADVDSGYRFDHPDLAGVVWANPGERAGNGLDDDGNGYVDDVRGWDFVGPDSGAVYAGDPDPTDDDVLDGGHGVHTAGTMAAAGGNAVGVAGVARNVRVMPLRVCSFTNDVGGTICPSGALIDAINYAGANGARVVNMSLGGLGSDDVMRNALAANASTLFVVSAGNDGQNNQLTPTYPCNYTVANLICVAATDQADQLAGFSNFGASSVDLAAPGTQTLSTYVSYDYDELFADDFEADDFGDNWSPTGPDGGLSRVATLPDGHAMTDSPGARPVAGSVRESTSTGFVLPAGYVGCALLQDRTVSLGADAEYSYEAIVDGVAVAGDAPGTSDGRFALPFAVPDVDEERLVQLRFRFDAGTDPEARDGIWIHELEVLCADPASKTLDYDFLQGTSMAAPHVTGAAGLLFSLKPSATVAEVRAALLGTVDPLASLAGKTVTGGRLDVSAALDRLVPPDTAIVSGPKPSTTSRRATFAFTRSDASVAATFECRLDGAPFTPCASPESYVVALGRHTFQVRAKDVHGNVDPSPASYGWKVARCAVPKLKGKTLRQARRALTRAGCKLGKVTKPKRKRGQKPLPLVVKSSTPRAGAVRAEGTKVKLTMKVKPPRRRR